MMKLATWNLKLPLSAPRRKALHSLMDLQKADVWVLTETDDEFTHGLEYCHSSAAGCDGQGGKTDRWVTIWSRYRLESLPTTDKERTAAARVTPDSGDPFVVYGTVLPWLGSVWQEHASSDGLAYREALAVQVKDWAQIRSNYPLDEFFVLGDFNQDLVGIPPAYYGSHANRAELEKALESAGLVALTGGAADPVRRDSAPCASIDHICARRDSSWRADAAVRWPDVSTPDMSLSDHFGSSISFVHDERSSKQAG